MNRKILLVEPNYKNKYPPMGLMKLATYYKMQGDQVTFFKGDLRNLVLDNTYESLIIKLNANDNSVNWKLHKKQICEYIRKGSTRTLNELLSLSDDPFVRDTFLWFREFFYKKYYLQDEHKIYDKVLITTLFTFYWDITIKTINFAKQLCKTSDGVMVGGVLATILPNQVFEATGIKPFTGTIGTPKILDDNNLVVDTLPLDYSILEEIDYKYPARNAYYSYMTRGCVNKCPFCAVPKLEPKYRDYIPLISQLRIAAEQFGDKKDLLLLDNNVLASKQFDKIIDEIKAAGFTHGSKFSQPNMYEIAIKNLKTGHNDKAYLRCIADQVRSLIEKISSRAPERMQETYEKIVLNGLLDYDTATKSAALSTYADLNPLFKEFYRETRQQRHVDFNQGIDARLITDENMKKLAEIPVRPVRIAFDSWKLAKTYEKAVRIAAKHGHLNLSNYILYNFRDKPIELYKRLKLNIELCEALNANIYSFPMKYHPIDDPKFFNNRDFIGEHWNRKFIRTIQAILNATKGKVGKGKSFFDKAFGRNEEEFEMLLYMPEAMIIYRFYFEDSGLTLKWWNAFSNLTEEQRKIINPIIHTNSFIDKSGWPEDEQLLEVLSYYTITREDAEKVLNSKKHNI